MCVLRVLGCLGSATRECREYQSFVQWETLFFILASAKSRLAAIVCFRYDMAL